MNSYGYFIRVIFCGHIVIPPVILTNLSGDCWTLLKKVGRNQCYQYHAEYFSILPLDSIQPNLSPLDKNHFKPCKYHGNEDESHDFGRLLSILSIFAAINYSTSLQSRTLIFHWLWKWFPLNYVVKLVSAICLKILSIL